VLRMRAEAVIAFFMVFLFVTLSAEFCFPAVIS
jgi:hypothetical protein